MKIVFIGDPSGAPNPPVCRMYGHSFPIGEPVEVANEAVAQKLARNSHFQPAEQDSAVGANPSSPRRRRRKVEAEPIQAELVTDDDQNQE